MKLHRSLNGLFAQSDQYKRRGLPARPRKPGKVGRYLSVRPSPLPHQPLPAYVTFVFRVIEDADGGFYRLQVKGPRAGHDQEDRDGDLDQPQPRCQGSVPGEDTALLPPPPLLPPGAADALDPQVFPSVKQLQQNQDRGR